MALYSHAVLNVDYFSLNSQKLPFADIYYNRPTQPDDKLSLADDTVAFDVVVCVGGDGVVVVVVT